MRAGAALFVLHAASCGRVSFEAFEDARVEHPEDAGVEHPEDASLWMWACPTPGELGHDFTTMPAWATVWKAPASSTVAVTIMDEALHIAPTTTPGDYAGIVGPAMRFRDMRIAVEVREVPRSANAFVALDAPPFYLRVVYVGPEQALRFGVDGVQHAALLFDVMRHHFWQLREQGNTLYFEVSDDGITYTTHAAVVTPSALDNVLVSLGAGLQLPTSTPGAAAFDAIEHCRF